ncbi:hypothetical protein [Pyxidicoccus sp. MSG2]|uniref:hypothetical protein n=1 Tax=Pyxidicoccus sp. MSG2 TaxID=2996790 RepID=UPI00227079F2|nr:hypothetical protein [Pyxidicoccus sp. MSG2]MCY1023893.1 hypothetical protein [Pyxidicoccus sp. MSG2]
MKTEGAMKRQRGGAWVRVLGMVLCGLATQAWGQTTTPPRVERVTTRPLTGATRDTVVASVVDTGVRTGASVLVTLRLVDVNGTIVAQTTGTVSEGVPLRLSYRAPSSAGVSAQVVVPLGPTELSAAVVTLERWNPNLPLSTPLPPAVCQIMGDDGPPPGPTSDGCHREYLDITL